MKPGIDRPNDSPNDRPLAISASRVAAMTLRYWYLLRSSWPRLLELSYWPTVQMLTFRSGWMREPIRLGATGSSFSPAFAGRTERECVVGATGAPFQASKERVTVAVPGPAASVTRTGPSKLTCQQRSWITHRSFKGGAPGLAA